MKKRLIAGLVTLSAAAGVVTLALFLAGVFDGDDATDVAVGDPESPICADFDCDDALVVQDDAGDEGDGASTRLRDGEADIPVDGQGGVTNAPLCAPGFPDCVDMIVVGEDGYVDDAEPVTDPRCSGDQFVSCEEEPSEAAR